MTPELRERLERLQKRVESVRDETKALLEITIAAILLAFARGNDAAARRELRRLELELNRSFNETHEIALEEQIRVLRLDIPRVLARSLASAAAGAFVKFAIERARTVLPKRASAHREGSLFYRAYSAVLANESTTRGVRAGVDNAASVGEPTRKMFVRTESVKEPRANHARLEGKIIKIDAFWTLGGVDVLAPGDDALPPSESINCKHANLYLP